MKINWFSPLPPAKTDIAHYTMRLLPVLSQYCHLELWTNQLVYEPEISQYAQVNTYNISNIQWKQVNQADINIYHLGNNPDFHSEIWQVAQKCPGLVVLHDLKLPDLFWGIYKASNDLQGYLDRTSHFYGSDAKKIGELFWNGEISPIFMSEHYPLTGLALDNSVGVITHSQFAYQQLVEQNLCLTQYIPLPYLRQLKLQKEIEFNNAPKRIRLIIFGHIGKNRGLDQVLEALAIFPSKESFKLDIYGELWDFNYINQKINQLKLTRLVYIHGFVSDLELETALNSADLAINLRYPTMGEASGSQLRIWSHALPSLVTKIGWYQDLPDDTVAYVRVNHELEDIHYHLQCFLAKPEIYIKMGNNARQSLEKNHNPLTCAEAIINFAEQVCKQRYCYLNNYLIERAASAISIWSDQSIHNSNLELLAKSISFLTE